MFNLYVLTNISCYIYIACAFVFELLVVLFLLAVLDLLQISTISLVNNAKILSILANKFSKVLSEIKFFKNK